MPAIITIEAMAVQRDYRQLYCGYFMRKDT